LKLARSPASHVPAVPHRGGGLGSKKKGAQTFRANCEAAKFNLPGRSLVEGIPADSREHGYGGPDAQMTAWWQGLAEVAVQRTWIRLGGVLDHRHGGWQIALTNRNPQETAKDKDDNKDKTGNEKKGGRKAKD